MGFDGSDLSRLSQRLIDDKAEIEGIKKIVAFCKKWQKRIEHQLEDDIWSENCEEELDIIKEMLGFCHKRLDELNDELNDIRKQLLRYNHGDYDIACEWYKWFRAPYNETSEQPPVNTGFCKICKNEDCPHNPLD